MTENSNCRCVLMDDDDFCPVYTDRFMTEKCNDKCPHFIQTEHKCYENMTSNKVYLRKESGPYIVGVLSIKDDLSGKTTEEIVDYCPYCGQHLSKILV